MRYYQVGLSGYISVFINGCSVSLGDSGYFSYSYHLGYMLDFDKIMKHRKKGRHCKLFFWLSDLKIKFKSKETKQILPEYSIT